MSEKRNGKDFIIGAVVGGLLGAATALLLAPKSGRELRSDISDQYGKISDKTSEIAEVVSSKTQEIAKTVGTQTGEFIGKAKEVAGSVVTEVKAWKDGRKEAAAAAEETLGDGDTAADPNDSVALVAGIAEKTE